VKFWQSAASPPPTGVKPDPRHVLFLRGGALGDFILATPVLSALRRAWPSATMTVVAAAANTRLALRAGLAERAVTMESAAAAALYSNKPSALAWRDFAGVDMAVVLASDPDGTVRRNLERLRVKTIAWLDPRRVTGHAADFFAGILTQVGLQLEPPVLPVLPFSPRLEQHAGNGPRLLIHPGSGGEAKNWPASSFRELADRLKAVRPDITTVFTFGEADEQIRTEGKLPGAHGCLCGLDVPELAQALAAADAYVGNDSGVTHLAAAVGTPVTALFGPTDPATWGPRGPRCRILRPPPVAGGSPARLPVDSVLHAVLQDVPRPAESS
jgi:heptosyltransferase-3